MEACVMMLLETGMREEVSSCRQQDLLVSVANRLLERQEAKERKSPTGVRSRLGPFSHLHCWVQTKPI